MSAPTRKRANSGTPEEEEGESPRKMAKSDYQFDELVEDTPGTSDKSTEKRMMPPRQPSEDRSSTSSGSSKFLPWAPGLKKEKSESDSTDGPTYPETYAKPENYTFGLLAIGCIWMTGRLPRTNSQYQYLVNNLAGDDCSGRIASFASRMFEIAKKVKQAEQSAQRQNYDFAFKKPIEEEFDRLIKDIASYPPLMLGSVEKQEAENRFRVTSLCIGLECEKIMRTANIDEKTIKNWKKNQNRCIEEYMKTNSRNENELYRTLFTFLEDLKSRIPNPYDTIIEPAVLSPSSAQGNQQAQCNQPIPMSPQMQGGPQTQRSQQIPISPQRGRQVQRNPRTPRNQRQRPPTNQQSSVSSRARNPNNSSGRGGADFLRLRDASSSISNAWQFGENITANVGSSTSTIDRPDAQHGNEDGTQRPALFQAAPMAPALQLPQFNVPLDTLHARSNHVALRTLMGSTALPFDWRSGRQCPQVSVLDILDLISHIPPALPSPNLFDQPVQVDPVGQLAAQAPPALLSPMALNAQLNQPFQVDPVNQFAAQALLSPMALNAQLNQPLRVDPVDQFAAQALLPPMALNAQLNQPLRVDPVDQFAAQALLSPMALNAQLNQPLRVDPVAQFAAQALLSPMALNAQLNQPLRVDPVDQLAAQALLSPMSLNAQLNPPLQVDPVGQLAAQALLSPMTLNAQLNQPLRVDPVAQFAAQALLSPMALNAQLNPPLQVDPVGQLAAEALPALFSAEAINALSNRTLQVDPVAQALPALFSPEDINAILSRPLRVDVGQLAAQAPPALLPNPVAPIDPPVQVDPVGQLAAQAPPALLPNPVAPIDPRVQVVPVAPIDPPVQVVPVAPIDLPVQADPMDPIDPAVQVAPVAPIGPPVQVDPVDPIGPPVQVDPVVPANPPVQVDPVVPANPPAPAMAVFAVVAPLPPLPEDLLLSLYNLPGRGLYGLYMARQNDGTYRLHTLSGPPGTFTDISNIPHQNIRFPRNTNEWQLLYDTYLSRRFGTGKVFNALAQVPRVVNQ